MPPPPIEENGVATTSTSGSSSSVAGGKPVRHFTWKDLSQLNKPENAHVAVRGKVYDVSQFVARHPGGMEQIMVGAGRDITQVFESYHSFDTYKVLEKYYVGELIDNELPVFPKQSEFYKVLKGRVEKYFKDNNIDPKWDYRMFLLYFVFFMMANLGWYGTLRFHDNYFLAIPCAVLWGMFTAMVGLTSIHDASHFAITHKPWVWKTVSAFTQDFFNGASMYAWTHQHVVGHHTYTNIDGADPDIFTTDADTPFLMRIKWNQIWLPRYIYQHLYMPILYCALGLRIRLGDFETFWSMKYYAIRLNRPFFNQWLIFLGGKIVHAIYRFIIPMLFMPWYTMVLMNVIAEMVGSSWLALTFQASHNISTSIRLLHGTYAIFMLEIINCNYGQAREARETLSRVEWPKPDKDNVVHMDWAEMQVATTQDYATNSWFWTVITGALNHQTTHHLFPGVNQSHYFRITPIVAQTCMEYGIKYHCADSTIEGLGSHIRHLKKLGQAKVIKED